MISLLERGQSASQTVATTPLRVFGASGWTGADTNSSQQRSVTVSNVGPSDIYIQAVDQAATLAGAVSGADYLVKLTAGQAVTLRLAKTETLAVVSAASSTVRAKETIEVA